MVLQCKFDLFSFWYLYYTEVVNNSTFTVKIDKLQVSACRNDIDGVTWEFLRIKADAGAMVVKFTGLTAFFVISTNFIRC